jgi:class 3 adenylate cyclase
VESGVNLGDVIYDGERIFGDGINVAARLEAVAEPGGVCLSEDAYRHARGKAAEETAKRGDVCIRHLLIFAFKVRGQLSMHRARNELHLVTRPHSFLNDELSPQRRARPTRSVEAALMTDVPC